jgi:hypothetical protein
MAEDKNDHGRGVALSDEQRLRTINVEVPETVYWHVRQCAIASRLSMKDYMAKFCMEAFPYGPENALETHPQESQDAVSVTADESTHNQGEQR